MTFLDEVARNFGDPEDSRVSQLNITDTDKRMVYRTTAGLCSMTEFLRT